MKQIKQNEKGFTLVELVVVIAILAVLAALLVPRIMGNVEDARKSQALADARTIAGEITTHNAIAATKDPAVATIPPTFIANYIVKEGDMEKLGREVGDFPSLSIVEIKVDEKGNATVVEKGNATVVEPDEEAG